MRSRNRVLEICASLAGACGGALIDYLIAAPNPSRVSKNPLSMDLAEAITSAGRKSTAIAPGFVQCCRSYRNLIPVVRGWGARTEPGQRSIAMSLVELITEELAGTRRQQVGLTACRATAVKARRDQGVLSIFKHLVNEANEQQRQKLRRICCLSACNMKTMRKTGTSLTALSRHLKSRSRSFRSGKRCVAADSFEYCARRTGPM